jgi:hypothetical protein
MRSRWSRDHRLVAAVPPSLDDLLLLPDRPAEGLRGLRMRGRILPITLAAALAVSVAGWTPATAKAGDVIQAGACGFGTDWELRLSPSNRGIEVAFEIRSNVPRQTWMVSVSQNGQRIFTGERVTKGTNGSFTVRVDAGDLPGTDTFDASAVNTNLAGELCLGSASIG